MANVDVIKFTNLVQDENVYTWFYDAATADMAAVDGDGKARPYLGDMVRAYHGDIVLASRFHVAGVADWPLAAPDVVQYTGGTSPSAVTDSVDSSLVTAPHTAVEELTGKPKHYNWS